MRPDPHPGGAAPRPGGGRAGPTGTWFLGGLVVGVVGALAVGALGVGAWAGDVLGVQEPAAAAPAPRFVDESATAGVAHVYDGDFTYFVGGGVAVLDCDDDGRSDLFLAGGENPASLHRNVSAVGGALRFEVVADPTTDLTGVVGAYPLDVDSDGRSDLVVLRHGENVALRGLGDCRFERANEAWSLDGGDAWTAAFSAIWEGRAALPTLAFGNYLDLSGGRQEASCADNALVRPADATTFAPPVALTPGWCALSLLFSDWDRSGRHDLRVANDRHYTREGHEQLFRVRPGEPPRAYTFEDGWQPLRIWGMGIASHDLTGDGLPEVLVTSQGDNKLQTLASGPGRPEYRDIAIERGVTAHRPHTGGDVRPSTAWHAEFQDVNNDGYVDLLVTKGNVDAQEGFATRDPDNLLLGQPDGTFVEGAAAAGIVTFARNRGAALVDLNLDGRLDLVEVRRREPVGIWRNTGPGGDVGPDAAGHWLAVRVRQPAPNPDAVGAWLEVRADGRTWHRELTVGGGHAGGQLGWVHVGLGAARQAEVRVRWPDGETGPWLRTDADRFLTVERGADEPRPWTPGTPP